MDGDDEPSPHDARSVPPSRPSSPRPPVPPSGDVWDVRERDVPRRLRLLTSGLVAGLGILALAALTPRSPEIARVPDPEPPIEALLVEAPEPPPPVEPAPPAPEPSPLPASPAPGPRLARVEAPREAAKVAPEKDAAPSQPGAESGAPLEGAMGAGGPPGSLGTGGPAAPPPAAAPPPPRQPKAAPPPEVVTPPRALSMKSPAYPSAAKSAGIEGTVVIAYVVGEAGTVTEAHVVKGPPELAAACLDAVRAWRFTPAESGGRPVSVKRSARFPFRLKT